MEGRQDRAVATVNVKPNKRLTPADRKKLGKQLVREYGKGASLSTLAARYGTSAGRVRLLLLEQGVTLRARGGDVRSDRARQRRARAQ
jgi:Helix-turn-helix domain